MEKFQRKLFLPTLINIEYAPQHTHYSDVEKM